MSDKEVKIKLMDEVNAVIIGLRPSENSAFHDVFKLQAPGYFFNPKYKAGIWDGFISFFSPAGKTYVNLLPEIIPLIKQLGYSIKIIDNRDQVSIKVPLIDKDYLADFGWELGTHQVNAINSIVKNNGGIIKGGTGAGKTVCCWVLHDLYYTHCGYETLIIVPTTDLMKQTVLEFNTFSLDVGYWGDSKKKTDHPVVVSTWQTLINSPDYISRFKHIIMDECHSGKNFASQVNKLLNEYGQNCYVKTGMTGTLPPDPCNMRTLKVAFGEVLYEIPAKDLIDSGWLSTMYLTLVCMDEELRPVFNKFKKENPTQKITYNQYLKALYPEFPQERSYLSKNYKRNLFIAKFVQAKTKTNGNSVILVNTQDQGFALEEMIPGSKFIYGKNTTKVRKSMFDLFGERDDVIMITTFGLAAVGLNIRRIFNIFAVDAGKSFIRVIQTVGRGLRKAKDKDQVNYYDIYSNLYYSSAHVRERIKFYQDEGHSIDNRLNVEYKQIEDEG